MLQNIVMVVEKRLSRVIFPT